MNISFLDHSNSKKCNESLFFSTLECKINKKQQQEGLDRAKASRGIRDADSSETVLSTSSRENQCEEALHLEAEVGICQKKKLSTDSPKDYWAEEVFTDPQKIHYEEDSSTGTQKNCFQKKRSTDPQKENSDATTLFGFNEGYYETALASEPIEGNIKATALVNALLPDPELRTFKPKPLIGHLESDNTPDLSNLLQKGYSEGVSSETQSYNRAKMSSNDTSDDLVRSISQLFNATERDSSSSCHSLLADTQSFIRVCDPHSTHAPFSHLHKKWIFEFDQTPSPLQQDACSKIPSSWGTSSKVLFDQLSNNCESRALQPTDTTNLAWMDHYFRKNRTKVPLKTSLQPKRCKEQSQLRNVRRLSAASSRSSRSMSHYYPRDQIRRIHLPRPVGIVGMTLYAPANPTSTLCPISTEEGEWTADGVPSVRKEMLLKHCSLLPIGSTNTPEDYRAVISQQSKSLLALFVKAASITFEMTLMEKKQYQDSLGAGMTSKNVSGEVDNTGNSPPWNFKEEKEGESPLETLLPDKPISCTTMFSAPLCEFQKPRREVVVHWTEDKIHKVQRFSCKKLGKEEAFRRAQQLVLNITYQALRSTFPNILTDKELHSTRPLAGFSDAQASTYGCGTRRNKHPPRPPDELVYEYDGPFNPSLIYRKWNREWVVEWSVDGIVQTARWSCKKLGKAEAVSRAEAFVNLLAEGNPNPQVRRSTRLTIPTFVFPMKPPSLSNQNINLDPDTLTQSIKQEYREYSLQQVDQRSNLPSRMTSHDMKQEIFLHNNSLVEPFDPNSMEYLHNVLKGDEIRTLWIYIVNALLGDEKETNNGYEDHIVGLPLSPKSSQKIFESWIVPPVNSQTKTIETSETNNNQTSRDLLNIMTDDEKLRVGIKRPIEVSNCEEQNSLKRHRAGDYVIKQEDSIQRQLHHSNDSFLTDHQYHRTSNDLGIEITSRDSTSCAEMLSENDESEPIIPPSKILTENHQLPSVTLAVNFVSTQVDISSLLLYTSSLLPSCLVPPTRLCHSQFVSYRRVSKWKGHRLDATSNSFLLKSNDSAIVDPPKFLATKLLKTELGSQLLFFPPPSQLPYLLQISHKRKLHNETPGSKRAKRETREQYEETENNYSGESGDFYTFFPKLQVGSNKTCDRLKRSQYSKQQRPADKKQQDTTTSLDLKSDQPCDRAGYYYGHYKSDSILQSSLASDNLYWSDTTDNCPYDLPLHSPLLQTCTTGISSLTDDNDDDGDDDDGDDDDDDEK